MFVVESGLLGFPPCGRVISSRRLEETCRLRSQGYEPIDGLINLNKKGSTFLQNVGKHLPNHTAQQSGRFVSSI